MYLATHFAFPVITSITAEKTFLRPASAQAELSVKSLLIIGLMAIVPDMFYPHFRGMGGLQALSHSIWMFFAYSAATFVVYRFFTPSMSYRLLLFFLWGLFSHYLLDFFTCTKEWLYPLSNKVFEFIVFPGSYWLATDILLTIVMLILLKVYYPPGQQQK